MKSSFFRAMQFGALSMFVLVASADMAHASRRPNSLKRKEAKKECLAQDSTLKGKKLKACVAEKMKAATETPAQ